MEKLRNALANTLAKPMKVMFGLVAVAALGACAGGPAETSRNAPATLASDQLLAAPAPSSYNIRSVVVDVPRTLAVSESNRFYPGGDIVWREAPFGDRHAQVEAIVQNAMTQGVARLPKGTFSADHTFSRPDPTGTGHGGRRSCHPVSDVAARPGDWQNLWPHQIGQG